MTKEDQEFIDSLHPDKQYWWLRNVAKHGSVAATRVAMSDYVKRRKNTVGGFSNPDTMRKAIETRTKNRE